jgi:hypothetical protein
MGLAGESWSTSRAKRDRGTVESPRGIRADNQISTELGRYPFNRLPRGSALRSALSRSRLTGELSILSLVMATALSGQSLRTEPPGVPPRDGADWSLKGEGVVCCPCRVPCPCRSNGKPSYGHCEATLYLRIKQGHYENVNLDGMELVQSGGMCAINYRTLSALYFGSSENPVRQAAYMKLMSGISGTPLAFPGVQIVPIHAQVTDGHLFNVSIPDILEIAVDRNWGLSAPPMSMVAAADHFANAIEYVQNIRYRIHDDKAGLNFDYSRRQANYRLINVTGQHYLTKSMLVQFADGKGWFSGQQIALIKNQKLQIPDLDSIRDKAIRLRGTPDTH